MLMGARLTPIPRQPTRRIAAAGLRRVPRPHQAEHLSHRHVMLPEDGAHVKANVVVPVPVYYQQEGVGRGLAPLFRHPVQVQVAIFAIRIG
ncbi:MAG: hypothetical protein JWN15_2669 [Firmicutes bacterium]|nr:hypothetical protein [Bacillota bacterium]